MAESNEPEIMQPAGKEEGPAREEGGMQCDDNENGNDVVMLDGPVLNPATNLPPIQAELDIEKDDDEMDDETDDEMDDKMVDEDMQQPDGVMKEYLLAIQKRLQYETTGDGAHQEGLSSKWLLALLEANDWWIRKGKAQLICRKSAVGFD